LHKTRQVTASALHHNVEVRQQNLNTQDSKTTIALERSVPLSRRIQQHTDAHQQTGADQGLSSGEPGDVTLDKDGNLFLSLNQNRRRLVHKTNSSLNNIKYHQSNDPTNIQIKSNMSNQSNIGSKSRESDSQSDLQEEPINL